MAQTVVYDGGHDGVDVHDPRDGSYIGSVAKGEALEVPAHVADDLLAREDFTAPVPPAKSKSKGA